MKRILVALGLLLGCESMIGGDSQCADAYARRTDAAAAADHAMRAYEGACRNSRGNCDGLPEHAALQEALRQRTATSEAADRCTIGAARARTPAP